MNRKQLQDMYGSVPDSFQVRVRTALRQTEEESMQKRKVSLALVLAMVLVLVACAALAVSHWAQSAEQIAQMEAEHGYFDRWDAQQRVQLVRLLVDGGVLETDEELDALLAGDMDPEEAGRVATERILQWGQMREDTVTLMSILEAVWGTYPYDWSLEDRAWYTQILIETGRLGSDEEMHLLPGEGDIPEEEAIRTANTAILDAYGITEAALAEYEVHTQFYTMPGASDGPKWLIEHLRPEGADREAMPYIGAVAVLAKTGDITEDPLRGIGTPAQDAQAMAEAQSAPIGPTAVAERAFLEKYDVGYVPIFEWPHELRAAWSREVRPVALAQLAEDPQSLHFRTVAEVTYVYGVPDASALPEAQALDIAAAAVCDAFGVESDFLALYRVYRYYDITDPDGPLWKFYFNSSSEGIYEVQDDVRAETGEYVFYDNYKVEMAADSGEITTIYADDGIHYDEDKYLEYTLRML